jgi:hypothetical protein
LRQSPTGLRLGRRIGYRAHARAACTSKERPDASDDRGQQPRPHPDLVDQPLQLRFGLRVAALVALGEDQFVFQGMFEAGEFGDADLVAVRFQHKSADDVGDVGAEFAALDRVAPELV